MFFRTFSQHTTGGDNRKNLQCLYICGDSHCDDDSTSTSYFIYQDIHFVGICCEHTLAWKLFVGNSSFDVVDNHF